MKLIVGLGNPGTDHAKTRHNLGWNIVDMIADNHAASWNNKAKFGAEIAEFEVDEQRVLLAKPTTFYNLSGESVRKIRDFYNIENQDILVIHDEMALPAGTVRSRTGGRDAGNNGIKNLIQHIGSDFSRLRVGSGSEPVENGDTRPQSDHHDHVLSRPTKSELEKIMALYPKIDQLVKDFIGDNFVETTHKD